MFHANEFGIDMEVLSSTKIISGGATSVGGIIVDYGTYDWRHNSKLKDEYAYYGPFAFLAKLRKEVYRNMGACLSPHNAYLQISGLDTLSLRSRQSNANCLRIAQFLNEQEKVRHVNYPGLENSPFYELSRRQFGDTPGSLLTFTMNSKEECFNFINNLKVLRRATNLQDNKTLVLHPASTIFNEYDKETREELGVPDNMIRISVGIEDAEDLIEDIKQALAH
jgi:O-acetylhomoserine (thiol)-lyase